MNLSSWNVISTQKQQIRGLKSFRPVWASFVFNICFVWIWHVVWLITFHSYVRKSLSTPEIMRPSHNSFYYICPHIYLHSQCQTTACALRAPCTCLYQEYIQSLVKGLLCGQLHLLGLNYNFLFWFFVFNAPFPSFPHSFSYCKCWFCVHLYVIITLPFCPDFSWKGDFDLNGPPCLNEGQIKAEFKKRFYVFH